MVGFDPDELIDREVPPPYWPSRAVARIPAPPAVRGWRPRRSTTRARRSRPPSSARAGSVFRRWCSRPRCSTAWRRHTGWMSAVLDLSAQRRVEEVARQQQDRLQATARLATAGEMASLLSHELNQPLSAIAAYATGSLNMMDAQAAGEPPDPDLWPLLHQASQRIAEQAERAGRVIKSVHDFVRRREQSRESVGVDALIDAVLPLVRLQARKSDHPDRARPGHADAARGLRPRDGRTGAAEPDPQWHPGRCRVGHRGGPAACSRCRCGRPIRSGCASRFAMAALASRTRSHGNSSRPSSRPAPMAWAWA